MLTVKLRLQSHHDGIPPHYINDLAVWVARLAHVSADSLCEYMISVQGVGVGVVQGGGQLMLTVLTHHLSAVTWEHRVNTPSSLTPLSIHWLGDKKCSTYVVFEQNPLTCETVYWLNWKLRICCLGHWKVLQTLSLQT